MAKKTLAPGKASKMYRWKLIRGLHSHGGKLYGANQPDGDVIVTTQNLGKQMNSSGSIRVVKMEDYEEEDEQEDDVVPGDDADDEGDAKIEDDEPVNAVSLALKSKAALIAFAAEKEIPLGKATTKADIIQAIVYALE